MLIPATATVWAATESVHLMDPSGQCSGANAGLKGSSSSSSSKDSELGGSGFDVVLSWAVDVEDVAAQVFAASVDHPEAGGSAALAGGIGALEASEAEEMAAAAALRDHIAGAVAAPVPVVSPEAKDLLMR